MNMGSLSSDATFLIYVFVAIVGYGCAAGSIAVSASYLFVSSIYKDIRSDWVEVEVVLDNRFIRSYHWTCKNLIYSPL